MQRIKIKTAMCVTPTKTTMRSLRRLMDAAGTCDEDCPEAHTYFKQQEDQLRM